MQFQNPWKSQHAAKSIPDTSIGRTTIRYKTIQAKALPKSLTHTPQVDTIAYVYHISFVFQQVSHVHFSVSHSVSYKMRMYRVMSFDIFHLPSLGTFPKSAHQNTLVPLTVDGILKLSKDLRTNKVRADDLFCSLKPHPAQHVTSSPPFQ